MSVSRTPPRKGSVGSLVHMKIEYPSGKLAAVTRKKNEIVTILNENDEKNYEKVSLEINIYKDRLRVFEKSCVTILNETESQSIQLEKIAEFKSYMEKHIKDAEIFESEVGNWLSNIENKGKNALLPEDSASRVSRRSSRMSSTRSTSSSLRLRIAEERARIIAEKAYNEEKTKFEEEVKLRKVEEENRRSDEQRKLRDIEMRKSENFLKNLEKELSYEEGESIRDIAPPISSVEHTKQWVKNNNPDPEEKKNICHADYDEQKDISNSILGTVLNRQNQLNDKLINSYERMSLPKTEPEYFDGLDITKFRSFIGTFHSFIASKCNDDHERLLYLEKYTQGEPQLLVKSCRQTDATLNYHAALELLEEEYGNLFKIAASYLMKLDSWPNIKDEDNKSFRDFSLFISGCANAMKDLPELNQLNIPTEIMKITHKLSYKYREKWRMKSYFIMKNNKLITFQDFSAFIKEQSAIMNQPIFGCITDEKYNMNKNEKEKKVFSTSTSQEHEQTEEKANCLSCKKNNHTLVNCFFFGKRSHPEKIEFIKDNDLCFSCLKKGHTSRGCMQKSICRICARRHLTIMHNPDYVARNVDEGNLNENTQTSFTMNENHNARPQNTSSYASKHTGAGEKVLCPAVPVKIRAAGGTKVIETYAGLDGFNSDVFLDEKLIELLGMQSYETEITLTTMEATEQKHMARVMNNLEIMDIDECTHINIPVVYCKSNWPFTIEDSPKMKDVRNFQYLDCVPFRFIESKIGILIGMKMLDLIKPLKIIDGPSGMPYASLHRLGWAFNGVVKDCARNFSCHFLKVDDHADINEKFELLCSSEFIETRDRKEKSIEDCKWEKIVSNSIGKKNGHFEVDLPFKEMEPNLPTNKNQVIARLQSLKRKMESNQNYRQQYTNFVNMMIEKDYAEIVPNSEIHAKNKWYLTHFGVYHKTKHNIRVVYDCSLKFKGISLNDALLKGPDMTSNLLGILIRFRQGEIAITGDVEKMFYQVNVTKLHKDYLRFLWFPDGNLKEEPREYRVKVHIFGAVSSPSIANYVLRYTTNNSGCASETKEIILRSFYVDDMVASFSSENNAIQTVRNVKSTLNEGGFNLTQFVSNSRKVLDIFEKDDLSSGLKEINLSYDDLPYERTLGIKWNVEKDSISFNVSLSDQPKTKRGLLSTIFSVYDPLGIVAPVTLIGKRLFQETCFNKLDWDDPLPLEIEERWGKWVNNIHILESFEIPRWYRQTDLEDVQIHIFSDGSEVAFAAVAYLRIRDSANNINCAFVMAKSKLVPLGKSVLTTIPRIELNGAKVAVDILTTLREELSIKVNAEYIWTDSETVLKYIKNESKSFRTFVANKVAYIRNRTTTEMWRFVPGRYNPADLASRGAFASDFIKAKWWTDGPTFLSKEEHHWPQTEIALEKIDDLEIKSKSFATDLHLNCSPPTQKLIESSSCWFKTKLNIAWFLRIKDGLCTGNWGTGLISVTELETAENSILHYMQQQEFQQEINFLHKGKPLPKRSKLLKLSPFIDECGLLRLGGRISRAEVAYEVKHPIILGKDWHITKLIIRQTHQYQGHLGRKTILARLRQKYWIIGAGSVIRMVIKDCICCQKIHGKPSEQLMADLPKERLTSDQPPFTNVGIDCFGPFIVSRGRTTEKRYGVIFSCLASRAVHIEMVCSLDTSSFINALRRFYCRRGTLKIIRSDNGTNFIGSEKELRKEIEKWNNVHLDKWLQQNNIEWKFNPPNASHFGGIWEREIRSIRKVLNSVMFEQPIRLTDESLNTLFCEVECILNSRPLLELLEDTEDIEAITPNHILHLKTGITFPPGLFTNHDMYCKRRWRQVQYLSDLFWNRWKKEYLPQLQKRQKWTKDHPPHQVGDLVLLIDQLKPRNHWPLGKIAETIPDDKGRVRIVKVKIAGVKEGKENIVLRPISKIILLKAVAEI